MKYAFWLKNMEAYVIFLTGVIFMIYFIIITIVVLVILAVAGLFAFKTGIVPKRVKKPETSPIRIERSKWRKVNNEYLYSLDPEDISLKNKDGLNLKAWFVPADEPTKKFVICVHGYNCNGPDEFSHMLKFYHNEKKYNYFLPDLRGHGRSEGNRIGFGYLDSKDILEWIDYLVKRFGDDIEIILHGISMGAATVMLVNESNPPEQVKLVIEDCGFTNAFEEMVCTVKDKTGWNLPFLISLGNFWCRLLAGYNLKKDADPLGKMDKAKNPILFIHGDADTFVPTYMCHKLYDACKVDKDKMIVSGAIHAFSYYDAKDEYEKKVTEFIDKYI